MMNFVTSFANSSQSAFDHEHRAWTALLRHHVVLQQNGAVSEVDYAGMKADHKALEAYLEALASVPKSTFETWTKSQRKAFLINAYNAHTVELVLGKYPKLESIRDLGGVFSSPWSKNIVELFGVKLTLDEVEHGMLRAPGVYNDPRVHFAVNCASVGCPMLREEAYVGSRVDAQLDEQQRRFLSDASRNRWSNASDALEVSKIFDWYGEDFVKPKQPYSDLAAYLAQFAEQLADDPAAVRKIRTGAANIKFLDYDWSLNDVRR